MYAKIEDLGENKSKRALIIYTIRKDIFFLGGGGGKNNNSENLEK